METKHDGSVAPFCEAVDAAQSVDTQHLGLTLRSLYEGSVDKQPIPDTQIDLILRLRSKERALRRAS
ncbi:hypothetical protein DK427_20655 [Methylobacterium radiodurans]|uniref:Anti-sigma factor NepR domain-containing protein n=1 Tax=Methylobacterium radiodurans TaxID=2202828 RepID=A0A2U8W090_9HYPH|nr:hypothetical protein DK427_20655 [Methylobacterium radiodurans]